MLKEIDYLMESDEEALRLDIKTDSTIVEKQAIWAGIKPHMTVADICCGSGKTTFSLHKLVQPGGRVVGIDGSEKRIEYAQKQYSGEGIEYIYKDIRKPLDDLGLFDFIWVRFVLEYYRYNSFDIVANLSRILKPGGILCLIDLDHNCLSHYGLPIRLERTIFSLMRYLEENTNFDPYVGRKLYTFLYDLGFQNIDVTLEAHHLIYGALKEVDAFNWMKKIEVISKKFDFRFESYNGKSKEFTEEFKKFFRHPRRFTYTPVILCKGRKPIT